MKWNQKQNCYFSHSVTKDIAQWAKLIYIYISIDCTRIGLPESSRVKSLRVDKEYGLDLFVATFDPSFFFLVGDLCLCFADGFFAWKGGLAKAVSQLLITSELLLRNPNCAVGTAMPRRTGSISAAAISESSLMATGASACNMQLHYFIQSKP